VRGGLFLGVFPFHSIGVATPYVAVLSVARPFILTASSSKVLSRNFLYSSPLIIWP
jgi:hypothetical protein